MGIQVIGQYEDASRNSVVKIRALKIKKAEDRHAVLITNNCKQLLSQIHHKMPIEMFETHFQYPVNEAVAVLTARVSVTDGLWHFVEDFAQQFAYNCLQLFIIKIACPSSAFFIFKALIFTTEFLEAPSYCPITCIPIPQVKKYLRVHINYYVYQN